LIYGIFIAANCRSQYGRLLASGVTAIFFLHVFINMGMVMGIMPVVGAPLPLLTYGGTIMMTMLTGFGFILNVHLSHDTIISQNSKTLF
jgi:rod shape determining protein RodA